MEELTKYFGPEKRRERKPREIRASDAYAEVGAPDFWVSPEDSLVFEVKVANLSLSKVHTCAAGLVRDPEGRGIAARLPRVLRQRDDKRPASCSTAGFIYERFEAQPDRRAARGAAGAEESDGIREVDESSSGSVREEEFV